MRKSSKERTVEDGIEILFELQKNSNKSIDSIAKHYGYSRQKVWRIIKQFEKNNIIWGYTTIIDEKKRGLQKFILLLKKSTQTLDSKTTDDIAVSRLEKEYIKIGINIESSYYVHGEYDWVLIFTTKDLKQAKKFGSLLVEKYPGVIAKISLMRILFTQRTNNILNPDPTKLREFL
jgi:DNA-binding Lrp family transcriptional regulator